MSSPYREASEHVEAVTDEPQPLITFDVSGRKGADGIDGAPGQRGIATGNSGSAGGDAGPAQAGENAGLIRLVLASDDAAGAVRLGGEQVSARGVKERIANVVVIDETGFIPLRAIGGDGGLGGNGGRGGDGARGANGADATRWRDGENGGSGGNGGRGGAATSGAPGGDGGQIMIEVNEEDTPLLMLVRHDVRGGSGGNAGVNGRGGAGGAGGRGGDSYSWTTTSSYRDANGNTQTRTHYHRNSGGSDGARGRDGADGRAPVRPGADGDEGSFVIEVVDGERRTRYLSRYDLRLVGFQHDNANQDAVYEPGELVRVFDLEVENVGGMPTPAKDELALVLAPGGWVKPEPGELRCKPGLGAGERYKVPGELRFRIAAHTATEPSDPLEVEESILQRAMLPSVRRDFADYQAGDALEQGRFVIRYPVRCSPVEHLVSLAAGEASRVRFELVNQSRFGLGARSPSRRLLRVRVTTAPDSELGDEHVELIAEGTVLAPGTGWAHEIGLLGAGESVALELTVRIKDGAPEYLRFAAHVTVELGELDAPGQTRPIQIRAFDIRVARAFAVSDADVLLVVNHRTTREVIEAWEQLGERLAFNFAIWDLSREMHLDLERPLADGIALADWFKRKAIVILDNEIEGPIGPTHPHVFLDDDQATRAAAAGIDIAYVGKGLSLSRLLVPSRPEDPPAQAADADALLEALVTSTRASTTLYRTYWIRWWAKPTAAWLERQAYKLSERLSTALPERRHVVVHRFAPELDGSSAWMNRWKVGTVETHRTLDAATGAIVHAAIDDRELHDPEYATTSHAVTALLVMFDFTENLERLRNLIARDEITAGELTPIVDTLVLDLANELVAVIAPGWMGDASHKELGASLPRLEALARSGLTATYGTPGGDSLVRLAGRLEFLAASQVQWWEAAPPFRWMRRGPAAKRRIARYVERFLATAFGDHNLEQVRLDARGIATDLRMEYRLERNRMLLTKRRVWALDQARLPLASRTLTSDTEVLGASSERVMDGDAYDAISAEKIADARRRLDLVAGAAQRHATLSVARTA
ncbi:MAG: hypothetical protein SFX73_01700 [Kofleriaceae bacterium]|nr:hypothetical protein [Kofleriaceae bacterium]